ncbi:hypothetical protein AYM40_24570 [Paraburkholderia phytofirmans OLGA172]|uniref:Uncharacterized protein n=1 Tax=Paraburkholderia phytofirmans OLGA172 TaxID=1417228 RepID=A0A160FRU0_9BURK|nr:hypothetical protein AYM40_24570 [Paraburkholderia phytofirmans OLGA172]
MRSPRGKHNSGGVAKEHECSGKMPCGKGAAYGFAPAATANRVSASVCRGSGAEGRIFIGVQFWRVTVRTRCAQAMFYNRGPACNSTHEIESEP